MKYTLTLLTCLFLLSCNGDDDTKFPACDNTRDVDISRCYGPTTEFTASEDEYYNIVAGQIELDSTAIPAYSIQDGSKVVFIYRDIDGMFNNWTDDEWEERVLFEIENDVESFTIASQEEFEAANCVYGACGAWFSHVRFQGFVGSISGDRISACEWNVEFDFTAETFDGDVRTFQFSSVFRY